MEQRRDHERVEINQPGSVTLGDKKIVGTVKNISKSGAAVVLNSDDLHPMEVGQDVEVSSGLVSKQEAKVVRQFNKGFAVAFRAP